MSARMGRWVLAFWIPAAVVWSAAALGCDDVCLPDRALMGGLEVRLGRKPARIVVLGPDGRLLFEGLPGGGVRDGQPPHVAVAVRRAEAGYEMQFGSFKIDEVSAEVWRGIKRFGNARAEGGQVRFSLLDSGNRTVGQGAIAERGPGHISITLTADNPQLNRMSVAFTCEPNEHFMGLGGQSFDVDHRGQTVPLWVQEDGIGKAETDEYGSDLWFLIGRRHSTHTPMPIFLSSRGYALLLNTPCRSVFALCSEAEDVARIESWEGRVELHLFHGATLKEVFWRLTDHLGRPELPPAFAFAPWLDALYGSDNVRRVANKLRDEGVPGSVIWTEDWRGGAFDDIGYTLDEDWNVDRGLYPDFETLADDLHALGFKFLTYNNTFITQDVDVYDEAVANGYTIKDENGEPYLFIGGKFRKATLLDLTNPDAWNWAKEIYRNGLLLGADGYMADFAEWLPTDAVLDSGEDAVRLHNLYPVEFQRLNREVFDELYAEDGVERLFFVRSGYLGSQPLVSVVWAGDQQTDFSPGDGMPSVIPMGIGLGVAGFPYYGHDIAGYMSEQTVPATKELWFRWVSLGALSPVMRTHHGKSAAENWNWESDAASTAHFRRWATLHIRLFPYLYALARDAAETGVPMMRPLALEYPDFEPGWTSTDQFMLGDRIIVAPVVTEGAVSRTVHLPKGVFYSLDGRLALTIPDGGSEVTVDAPLTECPAFVPAGTVLSLLPDGVDTLVDADPVAGVTTLADVGEQREVWVWPGGQSGLYEVSGLNYVWNAADLRGPVRSVEWNGEPALLQGNTVTVTGIGVLTADGVATLEITGGTEDRVTVVRFLP